MGPTQYFLVIHADHLHHCLESSKILLVTLEFLTYANFEGVFGQYVSVLQSDCWSEIAEMVEQPNHLFDEDSVANINHFVFRKRSE